MKRKERVGIMSMSNEIIYEFAREVQDILGPKLSQILLFGSYARGDFTEHSDIDVMILVRLSDDEIRIIRNTISDCAFEYLMKYKVDISPVIINDAHFNYWVDSLPFYKNVKEEGVELVA